MSAQIDDVRPLISQGTLPSKAVEGEVVPITALVWREGHDAVSATLVITAPDGAVSQQLMQQDRYIVDRVHGLLHPDRPGRWSFRIDAWLDPIETWRHAVRAKIDAGQGAAEMDNDLQVGARLFRRAALGGPDYHREYLEDIAAQLAADGTPSARVAEALSPKATQILAEHPVREGLVEGQTHEVNVMRRAALFNSWYELFPRSTGGWDAEGRPQHGTFATTEAALERVAHMGFDTVYFPPIHPIGEINRKGRNNTLTPEPEDVGSPWAIGSIDGGHDAVHPRLGTIDDFQHLLERARELNLEVALDLALQAAPDHPWAKDHPEFFTILPDGTIAYAENPPKKYQDIYPINFTNDPDGVFAEMERVVRFWIDLGVTTFRVDNPHTKPAAFWAWLISRIHETHPHIIFLAEAFTRPARLYGLAKAGFSQSYTYFTWKTDKKDLTEFAAEIAEMADYFRPNLFVNTPDILHESLQYGGRAMFAIRATLAATMSPLWGVYSGFELFESQAVKPGSEEYLDSEKYELRPRDFAGALHRGESLEPYITMLNWIRRNQPALQQLRNIHFHETESDQIIAYSKFDPCSGNSVLVVVNLDSFSTQTTWVHLDLEALGLDDVQSFNVYDTVTDASYTWHKDNYVRLSPNDNVAHIFVLPTVPEEKRAKLAYRDVEDYRG